MSSPATNRRRLIRITGFIASILLAGAATAHAGNALTLWASQSIVVSGTDNFFCGWAHSNGSVDFGGSNNTVSGKFEYVTTFKSNASNTSSPVKVGSAPMPAPPHDLAYYRDLAKAQGTYYAGDVSLTINTVRGLIFSEKNIAVSGDNGNATATFVSATGTIELKGASTEFTP